MIVSRRSWLSAIGLIGALGGAGRAEAQADTAPLAKVPAYRRRLLGVYDATTGDAVQGVRVIDVLSGTSMVTSASGAAALIFLPEGVRIVRLQKLGYEVQTFPVSITPSDSSSLTMIMNRVTELPAVVTNDSARKFVSPRLRGFEERRKTEAGYFMTEDQLRKADGRQLANALAANMPGMKIDRRSGNKALLVQSPRCMDGRQTGAPQVYLDGVPMVDDPQPRGRAFPGTDLSQFDVTDLIAVEWYPDSNVLPIEFSRSSKRCGALLLWTRDR